MEFLKVPREAEAQIRGNDLRIFTLTAERDVFPQKRCSKQPFDPKLLAPRRHGPRQTRQLLPGNIPWVTPYWGHSQTSVGPTRSPPLCHLAFGPRALSTRTGFLGKTVKGQHSLRPAFGETTKFHALVCRCLGPRWAQGWVAPRCVPPVLSLRSLFVPSCTPMGVSTPGHLGRDSAATRNHGTKISAPSLGQ